MVGKLEQVWMEIDGAINVSDILKAGVYILVLKGEVVYVGKAKRMLNRVQAHLSVHAAKRKEKVPSWLPIKGIYFDEVHIRPCHPDTVDLTERLYIELYKPRHNTQLKSAGPTKVPFSIEVSGMKLNFNRPQAQELIRRI